MVRVFTHGTMGYRIDPSWYPIKLFLVPASSVTSIMTGVTKAVECAILSMGWCI